MASVLNGVERSPNYGSSNPTHADGNIFMMSCACDTHSTNQCPFKLSDNTRTAYDNLTRGKWNHKINFILATLAQVIGNANFSRFPYLVYTHGGGTFLISYFVMFFFMGFPLFFLELALGQYSGVGPTQVFSRMTPLMSGLGYGMCTALFINDMAYIMISSYAIYYLFAGFSQKLPWSFCGEKQYGCIDSHDEIQNITELPCYPNCAWATEDFYQSMLGNNHFENASWCNYGELNWPLVLCLLCAWALVGSALIQGLKSAGKIAYFTSFFPIVILFIMGWQCFSLDGMENGISSYITPDLSKLKEPQVWVMAATQILYSLSIGSGNLHNLASFNQFENNCFYDALLISTCNSCVSLMAGFIVFSATGFIAHKTGQEVKHVIKEGSALTFITLPDAVSHMPVAHFWSFLFFFMLVAVGLDTLFVDTETMITAFLDHNVWMRPYRSWIVVLYCTIAFLFGISMCAPQGDALANILIASTTSWNLLLLVLMESISTSWVYGAHNFWEDVKEMKIYLNDYVKYYLLLCWSLFAPILLCALIVWNVYWDLCQITPNQCNTNYSYRSEDRKLPGIIALYYFLFALPLAFPLLFAIRTTLKLKLQGKPIVKGLLYPTYSWSLTKSKPKTVMTKLHAVGSRIRTWPPAHMAPYWDPSKRISAQKISNKYSGLCTLPNLKQENNHDEKKVENLHVYTQTHSCACPSDIGQIREHID